MKPFWRILTAAWLLFLSGCDGIPLLTPPATTGTPTVTLPVFPTLTPLPSATPTPTPPATVRLGTPFPTPAGPVTPENVERLSELARWGNGIAQGLLWSPEGRLGAVIATRGVFLYDENLNPTGVIEEGAPFRCAAFSADGSLLAVGSEDGRLRIWRPAEVSLLEIIEAHRSALLALAFSPDGSLLASGGWDKDIHIWRVSDGLHQRTFRAQRGALKSLAFSADSSRLFSWAREEPILVWDVASSSLARNIALAKDGTGKRPWAVAFSPDGGLAIAVYERQVRILRTGSGVTLITLLDFRTPVLAAALSPDGKQVATVQETGFRLWRTSNGTLIDESNTAISGSLNLLTYLPSGEALIYLGRQLERWQVAGDEGLRQAQQQEVVFVPAYPLALSFSSDGLTLAAGLQDGSLLTFALQSGQARLSGGGQQAVRSLALSPDLSQMVLSDWKGNAWLQQAGEAEIGARLESPKDGLSSLAFSPDGGWLASGGDGALHVRRLPDGEANPLAQPLTPLYLHFSPDSSLLAAGSRGEIHLWRVAEGDLLAAFEGSNLVFSPDGGTFALAASEVGASHLELRGLDGRLLRRISEGGGNLAFSPDGQMLAVANDRLTLWRVADGALLKAYAGERLGLYSRLAFSPDGSLLAAIGLDGILRLWGAP